VGENVPVHIYTNFDEVELFVNGTSYGKRTFAAKKTEFSSEDEENRNQMERFRLIWDNVIYEAGEITAVGYKNGVEAMRKTVKTAGEPYEIRLSAYSESIEADGESLNYITAEIVDKGGNLCPKADNRITFKAEGGAYVFATDAGDQRETETFLRPDKKAMSGMLVAVVRSTGEKGRVTVTACAEGLKEGTVSFECK
jgi:beta-galactosidase